jgi:predicted nucleic acid-binding protein
MKVLFDTSVLVAACVESHRMHDRAHPWLVRAKRGAIDWFVAAHTLAELYAVLTTLPVRPLISPAVAAELVAENVASSATVVPFTARDYRAVVADTAAAGMAGGVIYDALIARAALKKDVDRLLTLNPRHFVRVWPEGRERITLP